MIDIFDFSVTNIHIIHLPFNSGRGRRIRTLGTRFWRPLLYQLSYTPKKTLESGVPIYHTESPPVCQAFPSIKTRDKHVPSAFAAHFLCLSISSQPARMAAEKQVPGTVFLHFSLRIRPRPHFFFKKAPKRLAKTGTARHGNVQ